MKNLLAVTFLIAISSSTQALTIENDVDEKYKGKFEKEIYAEAGKA